MLEKVVIIGPAYPLRGGIADFNQSLCKALKNKNIDCLIVSFSLQYPDFLFPGKTQFVDFDTLSPNLDIIPLINSINPINWLKVKKIIETFNPQLIITAYWIPFIGISTSFILSKLKKKYLTFALAHNIIPHDKKIADKLITSYFIKQNKGFIVLSKAVSDELDIFNKKAPRIIVPHPIYDIFGKPVDKKIALEKLNLPEGKYVLFFGLIKKYKGLDILLKAFAEKQLKESDIQLIIAGEFYDNKNKYLELIDNLGIKAKIKLYDYFIPTEDVKYFFSAADVVVQPYLSATQSGISQIAYNFDKPMIVTDVGGLKEIVIDGKGGYVVPPKNPKKLSEAIVKFFKDNKAQQFTEFVKTQKHKFSWDYFAQKIIEFYEQFEIPISR